MLFDEAKIVDAGSFVEKAKCTIQKSGRLGFTVQASNLMHMEVGARLLISNCGDGNLAAVVDSNKDETRGFSLKRNGDYFNVNVRAFLEQQGIDYANPAATIMYDVIATDEKYRGSPVFKLAKRVKTRREGAGAQTQGAVDGC